MTQFAEPTPEEIRLRRRKVFAFLYGAIVYIIGVWGILLYTIGFVGNYFDPIIDSAFGDVFPWKSIEWARWSRSGSRCRSISACCCFWRFSTPAWPGRRSRRCGHVSFPSISSAPPTLSSRSSRSHCCNGSRPIPDVIWNVEDPTLRLILQWISFGGWLTVLWATILVGHWKIFGVDQVIDFLEDREYTKLAHNTPEYYKVGWPIPKGALVFCPPPRLLRLHRGILGDADDDGRPSRLRGRPYDLHHDRNLFPRAKPDRPVGRGVCRIRPNPFEDHSVVRKNALTAPSKAAGEPT